MPVNGLEWAFLKSNQVMVDHTGSVPITLQLNICSFLIQDLDICFLFGYSSGKKAFRYRITLFFLFQETHIIHKFAGDFYGSHLKICLVGYLRGEKNFCSLDDLIIAIKQDIANAEEKLELPEAQKLKINKFFTTQSHFKTQLISRMQRIYYKLYCYIDFILGRLLFFQNLHFRYFLSVSVIH